MAETYMITAKTVEEAIAIANREYADENHEVSYEIIEMPKKGFLGIGAKDAKIKITVTKTVSLDSIVSDLRSLKVFTDKVDEEKKPEKKQNPQKKSDKPAQNSEKQPRDNQQAKKNEPAQKSEKAQKNENHDKGDNKPREKKNDAVKSEKPERNEAKQNQPKSEKPASPRNAEQKPAQQKPQNGSEKQNTKPAEQKNEKQAAKPAEIKTEAKAENIPAAKPENAEITAEVKEAKKEEKRGSLNNQGKPQRRQPQKHNAEQNIESSAVAVSAPMGLSDFVPSENNAAFGSVSAETKSSGRMSNDIRKAKKNQPKSEPKAENKSAPAAKNEKKNERVIYEDRKSMITRYDVAESDDDYKKLENLDDREMTIDEIRASVKPQAAAEVAEEKIEIVPAQKTKREAVSEAEMQFALEFANTLLGNMGLDASAVPAECPEDEEFEIKEGCTVYPKINIIGDDTGILIGHHGETLDAIQYLVNLSALRKSKQKDGDYVKIVVDIENYREKREETLRVLARRMAAKAVKYKRNVFLEPMNAYERRIIHSELQNVENVSTHSVGTDRDRKIIITYEGADKAPENKNRRRRGGRGNSENNNAEAVSVPAETGASAEASEKPQGSGSNRERRRPRKVQKMPIEKIGDILPDSESAESEE